MLVSCMLNIIIMTMAAGLYAADPCLYYNHNNIYLRVHANGGQRISVGHDIHGMGHGITQTLCACCVRNSHKIMSIIIELLAIET
jgi:hypothetical protein